MQSDLHDAPESPVVAGEGSPAKDIPVAAGVYAFRNRVNGKVYVGSSQDLRTRFTNHLRELRRGVHFSKHLQASWKKYGEAAFEFVILELTSNSLVREQYWLDTLKANQRAHGYNLRKDATSNAGIMRGPVPAHVRAKISKTLTGQPGRPLSAEHKAKLAEARDRKESRAKAAAALKGRVIPAEMRARISATLKGRKMSAERRVQHAAYYNRPEVRQMLRARALGRVPTAEQRAKQSAKLKGRPKSAETRARMALVQQHRSESTRKLISANMKRYWAERREDVRIRKLVRARILEARV